MQTTKRIAAEAALVLGAGLIFALVANGLSPRGLTLTRDYFPSPTLAVAPGNASASAASASPARSVLARLKKKGLQAATHEEVVRWYRDRRYEEGGFVFVDARNEPRYGSGHIPGAYLFNHYRADEYLAALLPACFMAEKVVVYCAGGDCEDSEFAAVFLLNAGVSPEKLFVYPDGAAGWTAAGLPLETGDQNSGVLTKP